eukprot:6201148-Pleurochrysis_carterae.AAC.3
MRMFLTARPNKTPARRGRGLGTPAGAVVNRGARGRPRPCASGKEKPRKRSASAPQVHMRRESKTANCACERRAWRAATVSSAVARNQGQNAKQSSRGQEGKYSDSIAISMGYRHETYCVGGIIAK